MKPLLLVRYTLSLSRFVALAARAAAPGAAWAQTAEESDDPPADTELDEETVSRAARPGVEGSCAGTTRDGGGHTGHPAAAAFMVYQIFFPDLIYYWDQISF
jgi:hypothetical protein